MNFRVGESRTNITSPLHHFLMSVQTVCDTADYTQLNIGKVCDLGNVQNGKIFLQKAMKSTSCEISVNSMAPGQTSPFFHSHKEHEEIYLCFGGEGEMQLNDQILRFAEGDVIRVAPPVSRSIKNTGTVPLFFICVQGQGALTDFMQDANITDTPPKFTK